MHFDALRCDVVLCCAVLCGAALGPQGELVCTVLLLHGTVRKKRFEGKVKLGRQIKRDFSASWLSVPFFFLFFSSLACLLSQVQVYRCTGVQVHHYTRNATVPRHATLQRHTLGPPRIVACLPYLSTVWEGLIPRRSTRNAGPPPVDVRG